MMSAITDIEQEAGEQPLPALRLVFKGESVSWFETS